MKKKFEKLLAVVIAVCVFAAMLALPTVSFADTWDGSAASSLAGEGTEEAPYLIATGADLAYFAAQVNGGNDYSGRYIKLTDDIDLNNIAFTPIGNTAHYFRGIFDGDGHTVNGLNISSAVNTGIGFFGACHNSTVKNLNVKGSVAATAPSIAVAGIAGVGTGLTLKNCSFDGTVSSVNTSSTYGNSLSASGLVSNITGVVNIDHCSVTGTIDGYGRGGGFIGAVNGNFTVTLKNSYCDATITGKGAYDGASFTSGGLIGFLNTGTISVINCFFYGTAPAKRSSGMAGPIINYHYSGTLNLTRVYYNSDNAALGDGASFNAADDGVGKTAAEFADGTVLSLLNTNPEEPVFEQGEKYPIFYVNKCTHENIAAEWTVDAKSHWHVCTDCGEKFDVAPHIESAWIIDQAATEEATGLKHKECTECGYVLEEQVIPVYNPNAWDGSVSEFISGEGTEESPYIIANGGDLAYFTAQVNGGNDYLSKYIKLTSDIDLNTELVDPIGSTAHYFRGTFDGDGHTVSGLNISSASANGIGFFGACHNNTIKNLNVKGNVTATASKVAVAGLIGVATGVTIKNCTFDGKVYASNNLVSNGSGGYTVNEQNNLSAAGLVCNVTGILNIDHCVVSGTVDGFGRSGGLIGSVNGAYTVYVTNSYCDATVTGKGPVDESLSHLYTAGGLIGFLNGGTISLKNCFFAGTAPAPRANGMAGPVINHDASTGLLCDNVYYVADAVTEPDGHIYGSHATAEEFADGTITNLLNGDLEEPIFEQGEKYPVFYVKKCAHEDVSAQWASDETNHWHICNVCGEAAGVEAHTASDWIIDTPATTKTEGAQHKECTVCGRMLEEEIIPILPPVKGDVNMDGIVNNKDVTVLFQYLTGWDVVDANGDKLDETVLDINGDKAVNNKDLTRLFKYLSNPETVEIF